MVTMLRAAIGCTLLIFFLTPAASIAEQLDTCSNAVQLLGDYTEANLALAKLQLESQALSSSEYKQVELEADQWLERYTFEDCMAGNAVELYQCIVDTDGAVDHCS